MSTIEIPGHYVQSVRKFIDEGLAKERRASVMDTISSDVHRRLAQVEPFEWYPVSTTVVPIYDAMARLAEGNDDRAATLFSRLGEFIAAEGANRFVTLMMRVMTPRIWASRATAAWSLFHRGGQVIPERVDEHELVFRYGGMGGYNHLGGLSLGFVAFALRGMGKKIRSRKCEGWSLKQPGPEEFKVAVGWE